MIKLGLQFIIIATVFPINSPAHAGIIGINYQNHNLLQETIRQQREEQAEVRRLRLYAQAQELQQELRQQQQQLQQELRRQQELQRQERQRRDLEEIRRL
ncbi:MAG TPA: hypothetical protein DCE56_32365 [Cyanobacteria bacterium UBA8553]|nr:hypothetical protein [Cyanobacteria bacterium UBA8553]